MRISVGQAKTINQMALRKYSRQGWHLERGVQAQAHDERCARQGSSRNLPGHAPGIRTFVSDRARHWCSAKSAISGTFVLVAGRFTNGAGSDTAVRGCKVTSHLAVRLAWVRVVDGCRTSSSGGSLTPRFNPLLPDLR